MNKWKYNWNKSMMENQKSYIAHQKLQEFPERSDRSPQTFPPIVQERRENPDQTNSPPSLCEVFNTNNEIVRASVTLDWAKTLCSEKDNLAYRKKETAE